MKLGGLNVCDSCLLKDEKAASCCSLMEREAWMTIIDLLSSSPGKLRTSLLTLIDTASKVNAHGHHWFPCFSASISWLKPSHQCYENETRNQIRFPLNQAVFPFWQFNLPLVPFLFSIQPSLVFMQRLIIVCPALSNSFH